MKLDALVLALKKSYPQIELESDTTFFWSPTDKKVHYDKHNQSLEGVWALLHETGHALLEHAKYFTDIELVNMEVAAWEEAKRISDTFGIDIDEDHVQDCLDSYRDWLYKRSLCPDCRLSGIQIDTRMYTCIFCHQHWQVTTERFCRPYRRSI